MVHQRSTPYFIGGQPMGFLEVESSIIDENDRRELMKYDEDDSEEDGWPSWTADLDRSVAALDEKFVEENYNYGEDDED